MEMKVYLRTKGNLLELRDAYVKVFEAKVISTSILNQQDADMNRESGEPTATFVNLSLFGQLTVLIARYDNNMGPYGYNGDVILKVDQDTFINTYEKLSESEDFTIDYAPRAYGWGTTITKFYDKWGNGWVLETKTKTDA